MGFKNAIAPNIPGVQTPTPRQEKSGSLEGHEVMPVRNSGSGEVKTAMVVVCGCICFIMLSAVMANGLIGGCLWGCAGSNAAMLIAGKVFTYLAVAQAGIVLVTCCIATSCKVFPTKNSG